MEEPTTLLNTRTHCRTPPLTGSGYPGATARHHTHWDNDRQPVPVKRSELDPPNYTTGNRTRATLIRSPARYLETKEADVIGLTSTLSSVCVGAVEGWTAAGIPYLQQPRNISENVTIAGISYEEGSWIGSLSPLGSLVGAIPAGYLANRIGRRAILLILGIPMLLGWIMIIFADHSIPMLYSARLILGFTCGVVTVASPLYTEEVADVSNRGALGIYMTITFAVGVFYVYLVGAVLPYFWMSIASTITPVIFVLTFFWMPESPIYLLTKDRVEDARKSLCWLRGVHLPIAETEDEFREMQSFVKGYQAKVSAPSNQSAYSNVRIFFKNFRTPATLKATCIIFGLMIFRQLCGEYAVLAYTVEMFSVSGSFLNPYTCTIIVGAIQVIAAYIPYYIVDRVGRRILLIVSGAGMGVSLLALVIRFYLVDKGVEISLMGWVPLIAVNIYTIAYCVGFGPLPWFMMPELLNNDAKGWVSSLAVCFNWALAFVVTKFYPIMMHVLGSEITYGSFFVICLLGTIFAIIFVPETVGKTREEIQIELSGK
ncbi:facilitated trehalose transporter Tret1-like [Periplaneta americana]|uniref:facilitated trehalose transporter Tret1-like n=1 Tax=Periplaneta americana TaxID=6978 RepID=UPI0037E71C2A